MTARKIVLGAAALAAVVLALMPLIAGDREIAVAQHHLDHAVLMFLGAVVGLAAFTGTGDRESPRWIWAAVLAPLVAMFLMTPSLYAIVERAPWLHSIDHIVFVALAMLTAYAGQRYVRGVGWGTALLLEGMAVVAAFGYGVAPAAANLTAAPAGRQPSFTAADIVHGKQIFAANCAACHGAHGEGGVGPSLHDEASRKDFAEVQAWIKKPAPPMPTLYPSPLNARDVHDVGAFVESLK